MALPLGLGPVDHPDRAFQPRRAQSFGRAWYGTEEEQELLLPGESIQRGDSETAV